MPTVKLTYTIGGDDFTPNENLYYKIYNDGSLYHTTGTADEDSDVSLNVGIITISNVSVSDGVDYNFTISEVDEDGLESIVSNSISISIAEPQPTESIIIETTSSSSTFTFQEVLNSGTDITWDVNGAQEQVISGNNVPTFDLSAVSTPVITGKSTSNFAGMTSLQLDQLDCTSIDVTKATDLVKIDAYLNPIGTIDLTNNLDLEFIWLQDTSLTAFDLSLNTKAKSIYLDYDNLLSSTILDKIINDLDTNGVENGTLNIDTNTGSLTAAAQPSYDNLVTKGWTIDVDSPTITPPGNSISPVLYSFRIDNVNKRRVYFTSTKTITSNNFTGFVIGFEKSISSIFVNAGQLTGHYFTMNSDFDFWDNDLIRYEGGSNMLDSDTNPLLKFRVQYIVNNIPEPSNSGDDYYVKADGDNARDGLTELTAWKTVSYGVSQLTEGDTLWVKAGDYGADMSTLSTNGTVDNPIKIIGYRNIIGDDPTITRGIGMNFNSSVMPLIRLFTANTKNFWILKNITVDGNGGPDSIDLWKSSHCLVKNCYVKNSFNGIYCGPTTFGTYNYNIRYEGCYVGDVTGNGCIVSGSNNMIKDCWAVSSKVLGMDYYIQLYGHANGRNNMCLNSYVNRFPTDSHSGHGMDFKAENANGYLLSYSLAENVEIINLAQAVAYRHSGVTNNVSRNITARRTGGSDGNLVTFRDNCSYNVVEDSYGLDLDSAILFVMNANEDYGVQAGGHHNKVENVILDNPTAVIEVNYGWMTTEPALESTHNEFINITVHGASNLLIGSSLVPFGLTNVFRNTIFDSLLARSTNWNEQYRYCDFWDSGALPSGTGNVNIDPNFVDLVDFEPQNALIKVGIADLDYDKNELQREDPPTIGAIEI